MSILDLFVPKYCVLCEKYGEYLCRSCYFDLNPTLDKLCPVCDQPVYKSGIHTECKEKSNLDGLFFLFRYCDSIHKIIQKVKYEYYFSLCKSLGEIIAYGYLTSNGRPTECVVTSVPVHASKMRDRGFNQAELIARSFAKTLGLEYIELIKRNSKTQTQVGLHRVERVKNLSGAFVARVEVPPSQKILLVDDIYTTGTTMVECTKVLKSNGIREVIGVSLSKSIR